MGNFYTSEISNIHIVHCTHTCPVSSRKFEYLYIPFIFQLHKRIESLQQQNRVLKCELETYKLRVKSLQEVSSFFYKIKTFSRKFFANTLFLQENRALRQASVHIQAKAEQEEEFISNTLLKKIQALKKEKENLALNYEQEEECLTNDLSRKLNQVLDFTKNI